MHKGEKASETWQLVCYIFHLEFYEILYLRRHLPLLNSVNSSNISCVESVWYSLYSDLARGKMS